MKKGIRYLKIFKTFRPVFKPSPEGDITLTVEPVSPSLSGLDLMSRVLEELGEFISEEFVNAHIVLDEFQEISELRNSSIEGILRKHNQEHRASYFFVGSRRRLLLDMFNQRSRPFYQSAIMYPLEPLSYDQLTAFLVDQFHQGGKGCPTTVAEKISRKIFQYPYYAQVLAYNIFEISGGVVREEDIAVGFDKLIASERYGYEAVVQGLTGYQITLLRALAGDPTSKIFSTEYMERHKLSVGGVQYARKKPEALDLIEKANDVWRIVDPVFGYWLAGYYD